MDDTNKRWKHIVSLDIDRVPHVLFYDKKSGSAQLRKFVSFEGSPSVANSADSLKETRLDLVSKSTSWSTGYNRIVPVQIEGKTALYLYDNRRGQVDLAHLNAKCELDIFHTKKQGTYSLYIECQLDTFDRCSQELETHHSADTWLCPTLGEEIR